MGRQDSRRGPIESPTEKPDPRPMRRELPEARIELAATVARPVSPIRIAGPPIATGMLARTQHR